MKLFYAGEVITVSSISDEETLEFQFSQGELVANKDDSDLKHVIKIQLTTPEDFIEYTRLF